MSRYKPSSDEKKLIRRLAQKSAGRARVKNVTAYYREHTLIRVEGTGNGIMWERDCA